MTTPAGPAAVRFTRRADRTLIAGLSATRAMTLAACIIIVATVMTTNGMSRGVIAAIGISPLAGAAMLKADGRALIEWTPIAAQFLWRGAAGQLLFLAKPDRPRPVGTLPLPGDTARLTVLQASDGSAIIHDPHNDSWTAIGLVHGTGFLLADGQTQDAATSGWGRTLAAITTSGQISRIQVIHRAHHGNGNHRAMQTTEYDTKTHATQSLSAAATVAYSETAATISPAWQHETLIAITLSGKHAQTAIRKTGSRKVGAARTLTAHRQSLTASLTGADATLETWLTPSELGAWIRNTYDPGSAEPTEAHAPHDQEQPAAGLAAAGPMAIEETWSHIRSDSAFHQTLWIDQWPRSDTHPAFLAPLLLPAAAATLSLHYQPIPTAVALRQIGHDKTARTSDAALRRRLGTLETAEQAAQAADTAQREADITAGHADMRHTALITITATTLDYLDEATTRIRNAAAVAGVETRILYGQQLQAFAAATLPITRGL